MGREPEWASGRARIAASGVDEAFAGVLGFDPGAVAVFDCGMFSPLDVGLQVLGSEGHALIRQPWYAHLEPLEIEVNTGGGVRRLTTPGANAYSLEIANVCDAISGNAEPEIPPAETVRNLRALEMLGAGAGAGVAA
jgi:predicted dehydrogenase